jgi:O-antigen/teichoic acid export membrane protein
MTDVTYFGVARRVSMLAGQFSTVLPRVLLPRAAGHFALDEMEALRANLVKASRFSYLCGLAITSVLLVYAPELLRYWLGPDFVASAAYVRIVMVPALLTIACSTGVHFLFAIGRHQWYAVAQALHGVAFVGLGLLLMPRMGLMGMAWAAAIAWGGLSIVSLGLVCRYTGLSAITFTARVLAPPTLAAVVVGAFAVLLRRHLGTGPLVLTLVQCAITGLLVTGCGLLAYGRAFVCECWTAARRVV